MNNFNLSLVECYKINSLVMCNPVIKSSDKVTKSHMHNYYQYVYVLDDTNSFLLVGNNKIYLKKNHIYLIKPKSLHYFEIFEDSFNLIECKFNCDDSMLKDRLNSLPLVLDCNEQLIHKVLETIIFELQNNQYHDEYVFLKVYELLLLLNRINAENEISNKKSTTFQQLKQKKLDPVIDYITTNYYNPDLDIDTLASIAHFEKAYFSKEFKKLYQATPIQYLNTIRLQVALNLLEYSNLKIYEISEKVGFKSFNAFNKSFKKAYNISPTLYKESIKASIDHKYKKDN